MKNKDHTKWDESTTDRQLQILVGKINHLITTEKDIINHLHRRPQLYIIKLISQLAWGVFFGRIIGAAVYEIITKQ